jgi:hypothetical protein
VRGPLIDAVLIAIVVAVVLLATAHLWGPLLGRTVRRIGQNLDVAERAIFRTVRRILGQGQGQVRPQEGKHRGEKP